MASEVLEMGQRVWSQQRELSWLTDPGAQGSWVIGSLPCSSHVAATTPGFPKQLFFSTAHYNKLEFETAVNRTPFNPEAFLRQRGRASHHD